MRIRGYCALILAFLPKQPSFCAPKRAAATEIFLYICVPVRAGARVGSGFGRWVIDAHA